MPDAYRRPNFAAAVLYKNPFAALDWLEKAFGFERSMVITDSSGNLGHAEMKFGDGFIMVGGEWAEFVASPATIGGKNTQTIYVHLQDSVDAHCERARAAGAVILREPEGHVWTFAQNLRYVSREEAEKASGLKIEGWV